VKVFAFDAVAHGQGVGTELAENGFGIGCAGFEVRQVDVPICAGVLTSLLAICTLAFAEDNRLTKQEKKDGWILLFNGKNTKGWMTNRETPSKRPVEDGTLSVRRCGGYLLVHKKVWTDFILSLDYKVPPDGNGGIFLRQFPLRPPRGFDIPSCGIEIQILDPARKDGGTLAAPELELFYVTGAIYDLSEVTKQTARPAGEWNHFLITCDDNIITVNQNGEDVNRIDLDLFTEAGKRPDGSPHKFEKVAWSQHSRKGYIGFQDHGDDVRYKNIKLLPLNQD